MKGRILGRGLAVLGVLWWAVSLSVGCGDSAGVGNDNENTNGNANGNGNQGPDAAVVVDGAVSPDGAVATDGAVDLDAGPVSYDCQNPHPDWLLCEDFEGGNGDYDLWWAGTDFLQALGGDDRGRIDLDNTQVHGGGWAIHYPAAPTSGYRGASLDWRACDGPQQTNCLQRRFDTLYFRAWIRFAPDHDYVHHFLNIGGSQPDDYWYHGTAGCLPNGELAMGTTVDFYNTSHNSFFYTYHPEMSCDPNCGNYSDVEAICADCLSKGLPTCTQQEQCCWGNIDAPTPSVPLPVGSWFCFEMTMTANTPNQHDGSMSYWVNGTLGHEVTGMMWRTVPELALNRVRLQHYITEDDARGSRTRCGSTTWWCPRAPSGASRLFGSLDDQIGQRTLGDVVDVVFVAPISGLPAGREVVDVDGLCRHTDCDAEPDLQRLGQGESAAETRAIHRADHATSQAELSGAEQHGLRHDAGVLARVSRDAGVVQDDDVPRGALVLGGAVPVAQVTGPA